MVVELEAQMVKATHVLGCSDLFTPDLYNESALIKKLQHIYNLWLKMSSVNSCHLGL